MYVQIQINRNRKKRNKDTISKSRGGLTHMQAIYVAAPSLSRADVCTNTISNRNTNNNSNTYTNVDTCKQLMLLPPLYPEQC